MTPLAWPRRRLLAGAGAAIVLHPAAAQPEAVSCATRLRVPDREVAPPAAGVPTTRRRHLLAAGPVDALRLGYVNWIGTAPGPADITVRAAIELPSGRIVPVTFRGAPSVRIAPGGLAISDAAPCALAPGAIFLTRTAVAPGTTWPADADIAGGPVPDGFALAPPGTDLVDAGAIPDAARTVPGYAPSLILGLPSTASNPAPSVAVLGDSIAYGAGDGAGDPAGNHGFIERLLAGRAGLLNLARNGDTASGFAAAPAQRLALLRHSGCDRAVVNYGTNDIAGGRSLDDVKSSLAAVWALLAGAGVRRIFHCTLVPRPNAPGAAVRTALNAWLREAPPGLAGILDAAACVERDGAWQTDPGPLTDDGIHPNPLGAATLARRLTATSILAPRS